MKKLLSIILATILILSIVSSFTAIAVSTDDDYAITKNDVTETTPGTTDIEPSSEQEQTTSEQVTTEPATDIEPTTPVKPPVVKVKKISMMKSYLHLKIGKKATIKATVTPTNATNRKINWKSSNTKVAKVNQNGKVTAKKAGACTVTATTKDGSRKSAKCLVVVGKLAKKIALNKTNATIYTGEKLKLKATFTPKKIAYKGIKWTTSDSKIAKVSKKGKVTALKKGSVVIKATTKDGSKKAAKCKIIVKSSDDKKITSKEIHTKKSMNRICKKINSFFKKSGAVIDPSLSGYGQWFIYSPSLSSSSEKTETINRHYYDALWGIMFRFFEDFYFPYDEANSYKVTWNGMKRKEAYKWLEDADKIYNNDLLSPKLSGWKEYIEKIKTTTYQVEDENFNIITKKDNYLLYAEPFYWTYDKVLKHNVYYIKIYHTYQSDLEPNLI